MKVQKVWSSFKRYQKLASLERAHSFPGRCFPSSRIYDDSDSEDCRSRDVQQGYLAVYVGPERLRFLLKTQYLNHRLFRELLEKAEEEFGHHHNGGLTIHCEVEVFEDLLWRVASGETAAPPGPRPPSPPHSLTLLSVQSG
ncbi:auxin-responsive protein SAUR50 [Selaginella moellendorffii]|uniref:auxin-responsive protein SAUR50 n=1 Tax=Selaginella moellendorffii TaxID=88036 RepID=UPI000D1CB31A|nr:auxin-responsive protein SAUR50 [Selaginella moellendorffii]|eukprot:XP_024519565.1 auxin-responsive protein SAUR50 [Selaginella moellendorffii]